MVYCRTGNFTRLLVALLVLFVCVISLKTVRPL